MISTYFTQLPDGSNVFAREDGPKDGPVFLLLHGFPSSSLQYRELIPILAEKYRVIAPDLPAFGFTTVPKDYKYTFDALSHTIEQFIDALDLTSFKVYIFDYGAPVLLRIALRRPELIKGLVTQNGNAYEEGLGEIWVKSGIKSLWTGDEQLVKSIREKISGVFSLEWFKAKYTEGHPNPSTVDPTLGTLDYFVNTQNLTAHLDLFQDYGTNVDLYPQFQAYLRKHQPPTLVIWGNDDPYFLPPGATAFKKDIEEKSIEVELLDAGHFALESHNDYIAGRVLEFFEGRGL